MAGIIGSPTLTNALPRSPRPKHPPASEEQEKHAKLSAKKRLLEDAPETRINVDVGDVSAARNRVERAHDRAEWLLSFPWNGRFGVRGMHTNCRAMSKTRGWARSSKSTPPNLQSAHNLVVSFSGLGSTATGLERSLNGCGPCGGVWQCFHRFVLLLGISRDNPQNKSAAGKLVADYIQRVA